MVEIYASILSMKYIDATVNIDRFNRIVVQYANGVTEMYALHNNELIKTGDTPIW